MRPGQDSAERIRRHEVSRALKKVNLSPEVARAIDLLSRSLVGKLLDGPISEVMARAELEIFCGDRRDLEASCGLERHGGGVGPPGLKTHQIREDGKLYIKRELDIGSDRVSSNPT
jgi:glutamyl-tRNA reductase